MVKASDLIAGNTYFLVTYPDPSMRTPIVITYTYLGADPEGVEEDAPGHHYYFRYLPAFSYESHEEDAQEASAWPDVWPNVFYGYGESVPTSFSEENLAGFQTIDGLIEELTDVRSRLAGGKSPLT